MLSFREYVKGTASGIDEAASRNTFVKLEPFQIVLRLVRSWAMSHSRGRFTKVEREGRHGDQIRVYCDIQTEGDPEELLDDLNAELKEGVKIIDRIETAGNQGSEDYNTYTIYIHPPKMGTQEYSETKKAVASELEAVQGQFADAFGSKGGEVQFQNLLAAMNRREGFELVWTVPTKGRKRDIGLRNYLTDKNFTPQELPGLSLNTPYTLSQLVEKIEAAIERGKPDRWKMFSNYIAACVNKICGQAGIRKTFNYPEALPFNKIASKDVDIINKNMGEIFCALSILSVSNDSSACVKFPSGSNAAVIDFTIETSDGRTVSYSVKNKRGSKGTAMSSMDDMILFYEKTNPQYMPMSFNVFKTLSNLFNKTRGVQTRILAGAHLMASRNPNGQCAKLFRYLKNALATLKIRMPAASIKIYDAVVEAINYAALLAKSKDEVKLKMRADFIQAMKDLTAACVNGPKSRGDDVESLIDNKRYGLVVYPAGTHLQNDLNADEDILDCLATVLNCRNDIIEVVTQISIDGRGNLQVSAPKQYRFTESRFRFDYNGKRNDEGNNRGMGYKLIKS